MVQKQKSQRQLQASQQIKKVLAEIFMKEGYSTIAGNYITILEADISPDFKNCKIFVDILGEESEKPKVLKHLNSISKNLRYELSKKLAMRTSPEIKFFLDETSQNALDIEVLLNQESKNFKD